MKVYTKLMEFNDVPMENWSLYTDVECQECGKNQSLPIYRSNGNKCIKCGSEIHV